MKKQVKNKNTTHEQSGFTLSEAMITVSILGILSSIAVPNVYDRYQTSCQNQQQTYISQASLQAQAYNDEYGSPAESWSDLDRISTLMGKSGPAKGDSFEPIDLPSCSYKLTATRDNYTYIFTANPTSNDSNYNIVSCINVATGSSSIKKGNKDQSASTADLKCI